MNAKARKLFYDRIVKSTEGNKPFHMQLKWETFKRLLEIYELECNELNAEGGQDNES